MTTPRIPATLLNLAVPIDVLVPYDRNPRRGDVATIAESLTTNGQYRPIVVRTGSNQVLAGNHTLLAARHLGWDALAATFVDCTDEEAARIVLIDNRANDRGGYDDDVLTELLSSIANLAGTGYDEHDLNALMALREEWPAEDGELQDALDAADRSMWPWVKVQLNPAEYDAFIAVPGADDAGRLRHLLTRTTV